MLGLEQFVTARVILLYGKIMLTAGRHRAAARQVHPLTVHGLLRYYRPLVLVCAQLF